MRNDQSELGLFIVNQFTECVQCCGKVTLLQHVNEKLTTYHRWLLHATNCFQQHFLSKIRMAENQPAYLIINVIIYLSDSPEDFWESVRLTMIGPLDLTWRLIYFLCKSLILLSWIYASLIDEKLDVPVNHSSIKALPGPSSVFFVVVDLWCIVGIELRKFGWLVYRHSVHI